MGNKTEKKKKGLKITSITFFMLAITLIISVLSIVGLNHLYSNYTQMILDTDRYIKAMEEIEKLKEASVYLTEECRLFVLSRNQEHIYNYFDEVNDGKRRENAIEKIKDVLDDDKGEAYMAIKEALDASYMLMEREIHAMKLTAVMIGMPEENMPKAVREYKLKSEEKSYTDSKIKEMSYQLVYNNGYMEERHMIDNKLEEGAEKVLEKMSQIQNESRLKMKISILKQILYVAILVISILIVFVLIYTLVIRTVTKYVENIQAGEKMDDNQGTTEFKYLALAYNQLADKNNAQKNKLKKKAEYDALTGAMNRNAFESIMDCLQTPNTCIALLIIDIDYFKEVNDKYGHDAGDRALRKVSKLLFEQFRAGDYVIRYGGDEFVVIMTDVHPSYRQIIANKVDLINAELQNPSDGLPKLSISVGVAFSSNGYTEQLFNNADNALYHTKRNGRCGYHFYLI